MMPSDGTSSRRITSMTFLSSSLRLRSAGRVRQQRRVARALDGDRQAALVLGARSRRAARHDAAALAHEGLEHFRPLVVERQRLLRAEAANPAAPARTSEAATRP